MFLMTNTFLLSIFDIVVKIRQQSNDKVPYVDGYQVTI